MDRHDIPEATAKDVAEAHQKDLMIQHKYCCRALTYWYDEKKGMAFCLIEAPDKGSVQNLHDSAHGLIPNKIIEVESNIVESFLGRIEDPADQSSSDSVVINDPAFRTIMVVYLNETIQLHSRVASEANFNLLDDLKMILTDEVTSHKGRTVEHAKECFMASFVSVTQSVLCALTIEKHFRKQDNNTYGIKNHIRIGMSAGVPVSGDDEFFEHTVKSAKRIGLMAHPGQIMLASSISELHEIQMLNTKEKNTSILALNPEEEEFLNQVMDIIEKRGCDPEFGVESFGHRIGMSKSQLYRKLTAVTGYSPNNFIKEYRLKTAFRLLDKQKGNISEIAYHSGFNSPSYFTKCFQERFDLLPSDYANTLT